MRTVWIYLLLTIGIVQSIEIKGVQLAGMPYTRLPLGDYRSHQALERLATTGATYVSIPITVFQDFKNSSLSYLGVHGFITPSGTNEAPSDKDLIGIIQAAKNLNLKVALQFHALVNAPYWPNSRDIGHYWSYFNAAKWFERYSEHVEHYLKLLEPHGIDLISLGHNFLGISGYEQNWKQLAAKVRTLSKAQLTYSAAFGDEERQTGFWDSLDYLGVFPRFKSSNQESLQVELKEFARTLLYMHKLWKRPVIVTRVAACSRSAEPIPQEILFQAVHDTIANLPYVKGIIFGDWAADILYDSKTDVSYNIQGKTSEELVRKLFGGQVRQIDRPEGSPEYRFNCECLKGEISADL
jgi:hypothetical protein